MFIDRIVLHIPGNILSYPKMSVYPSMSIIKLNIQEFFSWNLFLLSFANNFDSDKFSEEVFFVLISIHIFYNLYWECVWLEMMKNAQTLLCGIFSLWRTEVHAFLCENLAFTFLNAGLVVNKVGTGGILLLITPCILGSSNGSSTVCLMLM